MSSALASAKRKRAVPEPAPQQKPGIGRAFPPGSNTLTSASAASSMPTGPLSVPQAFSLFDKRIRTLEVFMEDSKSGNISLDGLKLEADVGTAKESTTDTPNNLAEIFDEYNARFDILAEEIANLKNIVLSLQSYTMEVNKTLMEERVRVLGNDTPQISFVDESNTKEMTLEEALANESIGEYSN